MTSKSKIIESSGSLPNKEPAGPGNELLSMLRHRANELGHNLHEMTRQLDISYTYFARLRSGKSEIAKISSEFAEACALYLQLPRMAVLMAAGQVKAHDCYGDPLDVISALPRALRYILSHPKYGPLLPIGLIDENPRLQYLVVSLFENATNLKLLPGPITAQQLSEQLRVAKTGTRKDCEIEEHLPSA